VAYADTCYFIHMLLGYPYLFEAHVAMLIILGGLLLSGDPLGYVFSSVI